MELLPIIETALLVFTVFTVVALTVSYSLYKIKKGERASAEKAQQAEAIVQHPAPVAQPVQAPYQEQIFQLQARQMHHQEVERIQAIKQRERFQVVNMQQSDLRVAAAVTPASQPFYHPRAAENRKQRMGRKSFNLFDNYSNGGEKLEKLNLSVNV